MTVLLSSTETARRSRFADCRWVPWAIVAAFLVVIAANGGLIYFALASWPGLTTDHAYDEGLIYNRVIEEAEKEARLGWSAAIEFHADGRGTGRGRLTVQLSDAAGRPLDGLQVKAELIRPIGALPAVPLDLAPEAAGRYGSVFAVPRPGQWDVHLTVQRDGQVYRAGRRIRVP